MASSEQLNELAEALSKAQAEFSAVPKDSTNPFFKSSYADLATVVQTAAPVLTNHGLAVSQLIGHDGEYDTLTTWLLHKSGQYIAETMRLRLSKEDAQGQGSATTYARRYSYMAVLGLVADEDDDGNAASKPKPSYQAKRPQKPVEPPTAPAEGDDTGELLTQEQKAELLTIAKRKGYKTKEEAVAFLDHEAFMPFTKLRASEFPDFKKTVIEAGWRKPEATDINEDKPPIEQISFGEIIG